MLKKLLITLTILTLNLFATSDLGIYYNTDNKFVGIYPTDGSTTINENNQDWVAVYPTNASNDWNNVIQWAWVKDLSSYAFDDDGVTKHTKIFYNEELAQGNYEVRYFLNNTYDTYKSQSFTVGEGGNDADISIPPNLGEIPKAITFQSTFQGDKSWIGIYKKGTSNDWNNVQTWSWVSNYRITIDMGNLEAGTYEARLFYNNSYNLEAKVEFEIDGGNDANIEITEQTLSKLKLKSTYKGNKTWIGVYKKGAINKWENVKAWSWVTQSTTTLDIANLTQGTYEARLFYNNSYNVENKIEFQVEENVGKINREELDAMIANGEDYSQVDVSGIKDMTYLFYKKDVEFDITGWDVSNVTDMGFMFHKSRNFNQPIGGWDVSSVKSMGNMFYMADAFNKPIGNWDVSHVTYMANMFSGARAFNQPIGDWDVSSVTNMSGMLTITRAFNQPIGNWDVSNVTNMFGMLNYASSFNQPIGNWDVSHVTNMARMFSSAEAFNQPIGNWNVSSVTTIESMFSGAYAFNQPIGNWNVSNVNTMRWVFTSAKAFNQPIGNWDVSNVTNMFSMFSGAYAFNQPIGNWNVSSVKSMFGMFNLAKAFNQPIGNWDVSSVTYMASMFRNAEAFNQPIGNWDVSHVTIMDSMFYKAKVFNQDISNWNVNNLVFYADNDQFSTDSPLQEDYKPNFNN